MPALQDTLLLSSARQVGPRAQRLREQALLARARLGEIHLHVSALHGQLLSLGPFHPELPDARHRVWRRHTGGRAVAAGEGFLAITLSLPQRAVLGDSLRPEQILNRGVRGVLAWLRTMRIDPVYPGLDFITVQQQRLAHLGFREDPGGALLIQILLAQTTSLSETMLRLDQIDPKGIVPSLVWTPEESTTLERLGHSSEAHLPPNAALGPLGSAYAEILGLGVGVCDASSLERWGEEQIDDRPHSKSVDAPCVQVEGRLGPVVAAIQVHEGLVADIFVGGDFLAPPNFPEKLVRALRGQSATPDSLHRILHKLFTAPDCYALGMDATSLEDLLVRALRAAV
ncbi:MAG: hypothetical protein P8K76_06930 [Candidatus Binatia bacterium]|nr:hypothetical protein [Candidatus Binatia bacterium]MDG1960453.1 hypothetical protein [Candidatus Binatia bacterium]MDG2009496.1 hypothetical protein [Candidatus Binatia bacterium]